MMLWTFPKTPILCCVVTVLFFWSLAAGQSSHLSSDDRKLEAQLQASVPAGWNITGFEAVNSHSSDAPWSPFFPEVQYGYAVTFENAGQTVSEPGSKRGGARSQRNGRFDLWLLTRRPPVLPETFYKLMSHSNSLPIQEAHPAALGYNDRFVVTCIEDCRSDSPQVQQISQTLHLKVLPPDPHGAS